MKRELIILGAAAIGVVSFATTVPSGPPSQDWPWIVPCAWLVASAALCMPMARTVLSDPLAYCFSTALVAVPFALTRTYLLLAVAQERCIVCYVQSALPVVILVASWRPSYGLLPTSVSKDVRRVVSWYGVKAALAALVVAGAILFAIQVSRLDVWLRYETRVAVPGASSARVDVAVFTDYQCPACNAMHRLYDPLLEHISSQHAGQVSFRRLDFPLDAKCNASLNVSVHPMACDAAVAVRLADGVGEGAEVEDYFFAHLVGLTSADVRSIADRFGFGQAWSNKYAPTLEAVRRDVEVGRKVGVSGTHPTLSMAWS